MIPLKNMLINRSTLLSQSPYSMLKWHGCYETLFSEKMKQKSKIAAFLTNTGRGGGGGG